jgi:hypothetical protein
MYDSVKKTQFQYHGECVGKARRKPQGASPHTIILPLVAFCGSTQRLYLSYRVNRCMPSYVAGVSPCAMD